ncbi:hypothetical protein [Nocardiopsis sp. CC223A]|uniref:hypothetical protein n=1 Tax=Nocardiopsis sp. CC223A TaxID=3044051 RepID=UPI00278BBDCA|nr:hypothetical protein [Nocardiopsis sp. CC223A]
MLIPFTCSNTAEVELLCRPSCQPGSDNDYRLTFPWGILEIYWLGREISIKIMLLGAGLMYSNGKFSDFGDGSNRGVVEGVEFAPKRMRIKVTEGDLGKIVYGSDSPGQKITGVCRLCQEEKRLMLSHVAPKWCYKWAKSEGHIVHKMTSENYSAKADDGTKHYLLCYECEQLMSPWEKYAADLSKGAPRYLSKIGVVPHPGPTLHGVSREKVTKFLLGVLFKGHFSDSTCWRKIRLDELWLEEIRLYLLGKSESTMYKFDIVATRHYSRLADGVNPRAIMIPNLGTVRGLYCYELLMAGWDWQCLFRTSPRVKARKGWSPILAVDSVDSSRGFVLRDGAGWNIRQADIMINHVINPEIWHTLEDPGGVVGDLEKCPCGLDGASFSKCCKYSWYRLYV